MVDVQRDLFKEDLAAELLYTIVVRFGAKNLTLVLFIKCRSKIIQRILATPELTSSINSRHN